MLKDKYIAVVIWLLSLSFSMGMAWNQIAANKEDDSTIISLLYEMNQRLSRIEGKLED